MRVVVFVLLFTARICVGDPAPAEGRTYKIGTDGAFPYHDLDRQGRPAGFVATVIVAAARRANIALEWSATSQRAAEALRNDYDLWPLLSREGVDQLDNAYASRPWLRNEFAIGVDLDDKHLMEPPPTLATLCFRDQPNARTLAGQRFSKVRQIALPTREAALETFCRGASEGFLMEMRIAQHLLIDPPPACAHRIPTLIGLAGSTEEMVLAGKREHRQIVDLLRAEIDAMAADGELERILAPWSLYQTADIMGGFYRHQAERRFRTVAYLGAALAAAALVGIGQVIALRKSHRERVLAAANESSLRALSLRQTERLEEERARISREIHDELGQQLTVLKFGLNSLSRQSKSGAERQIAELLSQTDQAIRSMRQISSGLRPPILDQFGLFAAIEWLVEDFSQRTGIAVRLDLPADTLEVAADLSTTVFRIVQESLTNVARHSGASQVEILATWTPSALTVHVSDNGAGIQPEAEHRKSDRSLGILGMKERAAAAGGRLLVQLNPEGGTRVDLRLPLSAT